MYAKAADDGIPDQLRLVPWDYGDGVHDDTDGYGFRHPNGKAWPAAGCNSRTYTELGVLVLPIYGVRYAQEAGARDFAPGQAVQLVAEPDNPHDPKAIAVRSADGTKQAGYIKATTCARVRRVTKSDQVRVMILSTRREGGRRTGIKLVFWREGRLEGVPEVPVHAPVE